MQAGSCSFLPSSEGETTANFSRGVLGSITVQRLSGPTGEDFLHDGTREIGEYPIYFHAVAQARGVKPNESAIKAALNFDVLAIKIIKIR